MSIKNSSFFFRLFSTLVLFALLFSTTGIAPVYAGGGPLHVKPAATGTGDCLSWANACTLQAALAIAGVNNPVWVMAGAYRPTTGTNRSATFLLTSGASVYGGFAGTETERDQRDPLAHVTILHGNIGASGSSDNSYHVVTGATGATLDGFTITAGNADGAFPDYRGGGMYNPEGSSPTLANIIFLENSANFGGGLYNSSGSPMLTNVTFIRNSATVYGGGLYNYESNPTLTNVTFSDNTATDSGGGMLNRENSNSVLINVTFSGNTTTGDGGGMSNFFSNPTIRNTIFWGNTAPVGAQISNSGGSLPSVSDSVVQGGYAGGTNIVTSDPLLGTLADYGGFTLTIPLLAGSSAIDTGNNTGCPSSDQRGVHRPLDGDGNGTHLCDIGAYEFPGATFADVPITHSAWNYIERLYTAGITGGCGTNPLIYCPNNSVTRAQMAVFLLRGMHGSSYTPPAATGTVFGDVPVTHPQAAWIEQLNTEGITGGCGGGNYCPANPITRAQMAVFLLRAKHGAAYTPPAASGTMFADVPLSHPQAAWIEQLSNEGVTGGCGAGNYCPANPVTRAQMAIFLVRAFNLP